MPDPELTDCGLTKGQAGEWLKALERRAAEARIRSFFLGYMRGPLTGLRKRVRQANARVARANARGK